MIGKLKMNKNLPRNASLLTFLNYIFHLFIVWPFFWLISLVFSFFIKIRVGLYRLGVFKTHRFKTPIISIGNIEFGGTGKTPMVIYISKKLTKKNIKHVVVSRGYKKNKPGVVVVSNYKQILNHSANDCGDEPILLASKLKGIPVVVSAQKAQAIQLSIAEFKPDMVLLDDGFQSLGLYRDLDIVLLIPSTFLAGNFYLFPLGFLRDSVASLKSADFLICTKFDAVLDAKQPAHDKQSALVMDRSCAFDWASRFKKRINGSLYYRSEYKVVFSLHSWETNTLMSASTAFPLDKKVLIKIVLLLLVVLAILPLFIELLNRAWEALLDL